MVDKKYTEYAEKVINGEIVACEYIKLACQRYLNFLNREDIISIFQQRNRSYKNIQMEILE